MGWKMSLWLWTWTVLAPFPGLSDPHLRILQNCKAFYWILIWWIWNMLEQARVCVCDLVRDSCTSAQSLTLGCYVCGKDYRLVKSLSACIIDMLNCSTWTWDSPLPHCADILYVETSEVQGSACVLVQESSWRACWLKNFTGEEQTFPTETICFLTAGKAQMYCSK